MARSARNHRESSGVMAWTGIRIGLPLFITIDPHPDIFLTPKALHSAV